MQPPVSSSSQAPQSDDDLLERLLAELSGTREDDDEDVDETTEKAEEPEPPTMKEKPKKRQKVLHGKKRQEALKMKKRMGLIEQKEEAPRVDETPEEESEPEEIWERIAREKEEKRQRDKAERKKAEEEEEESDAILARFNRRWVERGSIILGGVRVIPNQEYPMWEIGGKVYHMTTRYDPPHISVENDARQKYYFTGTGQDIAGTLPDPVSSDARRFEKLPATVKAFVKDNFADLFVTS